MSRHRAQLRGQFVLANTASLSSVAKQVVADRFRPDAKPQMDMLASFLKHGLSRQDAETETMVQMYVWLHRMSFP